MPNHAEDLGAQIVDNGWGEWKRLVLESLERHNRLMEKHFEDDSKQFKEIGESFGKIHNRMAYAMGAVGVIVIGIQIAVEVWKRM